MSEEQDSGLAIGSNVGMALELALQQAGQQTPEVAAPPVAEAQPVVEVPPVAEPQPVEQASQEHEEETDDPALHDAIAPVAPYEVGPVPLDARIVALEFPIESRIPSGNITTPANQRYKGRVVVGPPHRLSGLLRQDAFLGELREVELTFEPFRFNPKTGRLEQGSLVNFTPGFKVCPECGHTYHITPGLQKRLQIINKSDGDNRHRDSCHMIACVEQRKSRGLGPATLKWQSTPQPQLRPDDPIVNAMYSAFCTANPVLDEQGMLPRVWGIYPADQAPTDWVPQAHDWKAKVIEARCQQRGRTIRPYNVTKAVQKEVVRTHGQNRCIVPVIERTFDKHGKVGPVIGFLRPETITPKREASAGLLGYTLRLMGHRWHTSNGTERRHDRRNDRRNQPAEAV